MIKLHAATLVSPWLGGRYRRQGKFSGEEFRDDHVVPALLRGDVEVDLDGIEGPSPGFLDEALGAGLVEAIGAELASHVTVVGVQNAHLVKMVMEWRAEAMNKVAAT
jgi:hypothetical protein